EIRVNLDLVDRGHRGGLGGQPFQVRDLEVGNPDAAGTAVGLELLQRAPGGDVVAVVLRGQWPVDQKQVDVVRIQFGQRLVEGPACVIGPVETVVELAGDVHLSAINACRLQAVGDALFVAVHLRGVDMAVADIQRGLDRVRGIGGRDLIDTEAQLGDL